MKAENRKKVVVDAADFIQRILNAYTERPLTGQFVFKVDLSQGGLAGFDASFKERIR